MKENNRLALYETIFIIRQEQGGEAKEFTEKFKKVVEDRGAEVDVVEEWGLRDLAYSIRKQKRGYYILMRYRASSGAVEELERQIKLSEGVLRFISVRLDTDSKETSSQAPNDRVQGARKEPNSDLTNVESGS
ncbi:MAG: 30S ribosomal protein S6 [Candidatus Binatia bacterium]